MTHDHFLEALLSEKFILTLGWARRGKATLGSIWKWEENDTFVVDGRNMSAKGPQVQLLTKATIFVIENKISLNLIGV